MAETPNATEPARFNKVIHHEVDDGRQANGPWHSSAHDNQLETRKQTDPRASGRHTGWWSAGRAEPHDERAQGGPVEPQGADELDDGGPPVDPAVLHPEERPETLALRQAERGGRRGGLVVHARRTPS